MEITATNKDTVAISDSEDLYSTPVRPPRCQSTVCPDAPRKRPRDITPGTRSRELVSDLLNEHNIMVQKIEFLESELSRWQNKCRKWHAYIKTYERSIERTFDAIKALVHTNNECIIDLDRTEEFYKSYQDIDTGVSAQYPRNLRDHTHRILRTDLIELGGRVSDLFAQESLSVTPFELEALIASLSK
jgi:hypothetical protein